MNIEQLKRLLHNVIERYSNRTEFTGEVRRDLMARDCLSAIEELEVENARLHQANLDCNAHFNTLKEDYEKLKRALWLARAERAKEKDKFLMAKYELWQAFPPKKQLLLFDKWRRVERKCRAYADKFKEEK